MTDLDKIAHQFLKLKQIAVAGVSSKGDTAANIVYKKLRDTGYHVYAVNPNAKEVEGDPAYANIASIPDKPEGVVIAAHPDVTPKILKECGDLGINMVWIHRSLGTGSYHPDSENIAAEYGITLIPGSCPMMFCEPVDLVHKCMKWCIKRFGKEPVPSTHS